MADPALMLFAALCFGTAGLGTVCIALARRDRSYWPLMRIIFSGAVLTFGLLGFGALTGIAGVIWWRVLATSCFFVATGWAALFMRKRNRIPRYQTVDEFGRVTTPTLEVLERHATEIESYIGHGGASPEMVARMAAACRKWSEFTEAQVAAAERARGEQLRRIAERRAARERAGSE